ncbi:DUF560 domain-containing protein [Alcaligenaceae bacterium CGII-47]|nr:DUF560 domain-containing protein [Alcaligenaceae bacterium CGII-47]
MISRDGWVQQCVCAVFLCAGLALVTPAQVMAERLPHPVGALDHHDTLGKAQDWLNSGQARTAYGILLPLLGELAGQPSYDYLLGQAALGSGEATHAAFAFERCLSVQPQNGLCRLGMARAHMALSETESARLELHTLAQSAPPTQLANAITDYLDELTGTESGHDDTRLRAYVQLGMGYDSNINNATSKDSIAVPFLGNLRMQLSPENRERDSGFNQAAFNIRYSTPLNGNWRFVADGNLAGTGYWATQDYNNAVADAGMGLSYKAYRHQFTGKIQGQHYNLDGRDYRNLLGLLGQYAYTVSDDAEFSAFGQVSELRYPNMRLRDAYRYVGGVSWAQGLAGNRAVVYGSGYLGREDNKHNNAPNSFQHTFQGVRVGGMYMVTPRTQIEAGASAEHRRYDGQEILFLERRTDTYYEGYLGFNYALNRKLSLRPQYRFAVSDSSIPLFDYQRHTVTINLRYELF